MNKTKHDKMLEKAKIHLMMMPDTVFFTTILFSLETVWDDKIPTAGVDGKTLWINPDFFAKMPPDQRIGVLLHEVMHVALSHMTRRGERDHRIFNMAGDYIINNDLIKGKYSLPPGCLHNEDYAEMNTEQVYVELLKKAKKLNMKGCPGLGEDVRYTKDAAENSAVEQEVADIVMRAAAQAKALGSGIGNVPGEIMVQLDNVINPKLPWNVIFQNYMSKYAKDDFTWQKPNRRFLPEFYLPSAFSENMCSIAEAVDCSGSVSDQEFSYFINETRMIQETLKPEKITIIDFDTQINKVQEITQDTNILQELQFNGRGGTDIRPVLKWAKEHKPEVLIVFTDGEFRVPDKAVFPECDLIWLIHNNPDFIAPKGEVIHYNL
jgi:predicted metal-dependent peptidase